MSKQIEITQHEDGFIEIHGTTPQLVGLAALIHEALKHAGVEGVFDDVLQVSVCCDCHDGQET